MKYTETVTEITLHPIGDSAVYAEAITKVRLDDEGGGAFIVLEQEGGFVRLDPDEIELLCDVARRLLAGQDSPEDE